MVSRVGHGDASLTTILSRQSAHLRAEIERRTTEMATGLHRDMGAALGGDFSALAAVEQSLARLKGHAAVSAETALTVDAVQAALAAISDGADGLGAEILRAVGAAAGTGVDAVATAAARAFGTAVAALNTRFSERALFSGVNTGTAPLPDAGVVLSALETAVAGAATVAEVQAAIDGWFADPAGYDALYAGGAALAALPIAAGESTGLPVTALDPAIKDTLRALATAALLDRGLLAGQPEARAQVMRAAGDALAAGGEARAQLTARVGTVQAQVAAARTRNAAETSALEIARAGIVAADPYDTATVLEDLQSRLESLYLLTSRVSRLSLTEYL